MLNQDQVILIFGSVNANLDDRTLKRDEVSALQFIDHKLAVTKTDFFSSWGELGLSSMAFLPDSDSQFFITTGKTIFLVDLLAIEPIQKIEIPKLRGIHELSIIKNLLWISNTYYDEVIAYNYNEHKVIKRLKLIPRKVDYVDEQSVDLDDERRINKFHCNQIFETYEKEEFLLVHHITGEQILKKVAQKLVKSQGGGGILSLNTNQSYRLRMKAPHSVRQVEGNYWVFDSGHAELVIFDPKWNVLEKVNLGGWGRGGCYVENSQTFFAGISSPRSRYLKFLDTAERRNGVLALDSSNKNIIHDWHLDGLEQVNNLYLVKRTFLDALEVIKHRLKEHGPQ